jgi:cytochrome c
MMVRLHCLKPEHFPTFGGPNPVKLGRYLAAALFGTLCFVSTTARADDGATLYASRGCLGCHGAGGNLPIAPGYPKIGGQDKTYLLRQISDIKSGARSNGLSAVMRPIVMQITDADLSAIVEYLSAQK